MSHLHARNPLCLQILPIRICRDSDRGNSGDSAVRFETCPERCRSVTLKRDPKFREASGCSAEVERRMRHKLLLDSWRCGVRPFQTDACSCHLMLRVRHCLECPKCRTRYLPGSSPYDNGSYLVPITENALSGWRLYCSCSLQPACSEWRWNELKPYRVCGPAYDRGYGSPDEVRTFRRTTRV